MARLIGQAVILCGGLGTRLGSLTSRTPKPLLFVAGQPFLDTLLFELGRHGIRQILLLAGFAATAIEEFAKSTPLRQQFDLEIAVSVEPYAAGTGGALWHARDFIEDHFILLNGDSWFDINLLALGNALIEEPAATAAVAVRELGDASRFGVVDLPDADGPGWIRGFSERPDVPGPGIVSGGVYACRRRIVEELAPECSLEGDIFPRLAAATTLIGVPFKAFFIDIGIPESFAAAQEAVPRQRRRAAAFLHCDAVLNGGGRFGTSPHLHWVDGARQAIRAINDAGLFVFVVTDDSAAGAKLYSEAAIAQLGSWAAESLASAGAHIDEIRDCSWRKPEPILDLARKWPLDIASSFVICHIDADPDWAIATKIKLHHFTGGIFDEFAVSLLAHY